jgi:hypothetical protein
MAVVMLMRWDGVSLEQYDQVRQIVGWEREHPDGGRFHVASHDGKALRVTDIWESGEKFQEFVDQRLMPGVAQVGLPGEPDIEVYPAHAIFTPGYSLG